MALLVEHIVVNGGQREAAHLAMQFVARGEEAQVVVGLFDQMAKGITLCEFAEAFAIGRAQHRVETGPLLVIAAGGIDILAASLGILDTTEMLAEGHAQFRQFVVERLALFLRFGKGGCHGTFVQSYPTTSPVPEIRLTNAWLQVNSPTLGKSTSPTGGTGPIVSMKDSTFFGEYSCVLGNAGHANPQIDADNSALTSDAMFGWMIAATAIRADFHGTNAVFGSVNARDVSTDRAGRIECQDHPTGTVRIRDGARMQTTRGIKFAGGKVELVFDGGVFEILPHTVEEHKRSESTWTNKDRAITTTGDGMEVAIC